MKHPIAFDKLHSIVEPLIMEKESCEIEYKTALGGFPFSFWETYSSFANTNGGTIVFGVKETPNNYVLDGLNYETIEKYKADFFNMMHNREKVNYPLLQETDVHTVSYKDAYFMVFYIPRADRTLRPIYCGRDPYTGTYRRDLDGDYHCTPEEIRSMFADANTGISADGRILKNYSMADLDNTTIQQYRRLFQQSNPNHIWNRLSEEEFLRKINVFRTDRETGQSGLTLAGLLMFGTYSALSDGCPNYFPDYQEIDNKANRWINRICPDGNWESNLFQFYWKVLPILQGFLPNPFTLDGNTRINETAAHVAIREALTNAIVHADYSQNTSLCVYKYPTKIVFSNPGIMLISLSQYYKGGESVCRNRYLQTMFAFLGSAEKAGSGSDKIVHGWESMKWMKPILEEDAHPNKVVLTMKMESLLDKHVKDKLVAQFGNSILDIPRHQLLTLAIATEEAVSNKSLQPALGIHRTDIGAMLHDMCKNHLLIPEGRGRGTVYHLPSATLEPASATLEPTSATLEPASATLESGNATLEPANATLEPASATLEPASATLEPASATLEPASATLEPTSATLESGRATLESERATLESGRATLGSGSATLESGSATLESGRATLEPASATLESGRATLEPASAAKMSIKQRQKKILDFCSEWRTAEEIAQYTHLDKKYLRNKYLTTMDDVLVRKFSTPHHPKQQYKRKQ